MTMFLYMINRLEIRDNYAVIFLKRHFGQQDLECLIDTDNVELVSKARSWRADYCRKLKSYYASGIFINEGGTRETVRMHRLVMRDRNEHGLFIDHINHNTLDNRCENLRPASKVLNAMNRSKKDRGVSQVGERWRARITHRRNVIDIGTFPTEQEARFAHAIAYCVLEKVELHRICEDALQTARQ